MAQKVVVDFELKYKEAVKNLDEFQKEYAKLEKEVVSANKRTADSIKKVEKGAEDGAKGIKKVGISIKNLAKASGIIFLLQKSFEFVSGAIQENQKVMDGLNLVFETAQILFNEVANVFVSVYENVSSATENFDALGKVVSGLVTIALTPLKLTFYGISLGIQEAQLMWEKSFLGDNDPQTIAKLNMSIIETKGNILDVGQAALDAGVDVVTNFGEAVTEVGEIGTQVVEGLKEVSVEASVETAKSNLALKKSAEIAVAQSRIVLEQKDREAEKLRQVRDEERNSIADRIKANNDLNKVLDEQEKEMLKNADTVLAAAQAQFDLTGKNEDYVRVLEAQAEKEGVLAQIEGFRSEQKSNDLALNKELLELSNSQLESDANLLIEKKRFNAETIEDNLLRLQTQQEIDLKEKDLQEKRLQAIIDEATAGTQAKVDAQIALDEFMEQSRQQNIERDREIAEEEERLAKEKIARQHKVLDDLLYIGGEETKFGQAMLIAKQLLNAKEMVMDAKKTLTELANSATRSVGKAAESGVDVASGFAKTLAAGFPQNIPFLIGYAAQAVGIVSAITKALKTQKQASKQPMPTPQIDTPSVSSATESQPPAFNIVGASETNQLADAIGGQTQEPTRAYVVATDVSTAQELDRNIIEGASIG
jgi:hypothetical protein